jgi:hypothetical protein
MSATTNNPQPQPPAQSGAQTSTKGAAPAKKPEQRTDHFKRAVIAVVVFMVVIAAMVLMKGIISPPRENRREEVGHSPVPDASPASLSSYEQSLAAYRARQPREQARTPESRPKEERQEAVSQQDAEFIRQGWRQPMKVLNRPDDGVVPGTNTVPRMAQPQPAQPAQIAPTTAPGQPPLMNPEELATRYQAAQERLARLRALQAQQRQQVGPNP